MPLATNFTLPAANPKPRPAPTLNPKFGSAYSISEIHAYIGIRDQLLAEAERVHSSAKIASVVLANDFVEGCLKPGCSPYEAQCLPEIDAQHERQRCVAVRERIAELIKNAA
ncbi:MAG: hypothetical protein JO201_00575 [Verrucomicrobia bacterium]|nr:hypothetical protein [Verrucomicrobiota bacterium]